MSTRQRIVKNGISALIQKVIRVGDQLLLVPFFINSWGADYYGEWLTLTIAPSTLALADMGFGSAAANSFVLEYARGRKQEAADISRTGIFVLNYLVLVAILLSFIVIFCLKYFGVFTKTIIPESEAVKAILILMIARILNFYSSLFEAYFRAAKKANIGLNIQSTISFSNVFFGLIILMNNGKAVEYAVGILIVAVVLIPFYIFKARSVLDLHSEYNGLVNKGLIKTLSIKGFGYFLSPIWQAIYYQGMTFVVRILLGPVSVTIFNTVRTLVRTSAQAFGMTITAVYPDFQFELGSGNFRKAKKIFSKLLISNLVLALIFIVGLLTIGKSFYSIWTGNELTIKNSTWVVFVSGVVFYAFWFTLSFIFEALNKPYVNTIGGFVNSIFIVCLSFIAVKHLGLIGSAFASLLFDILMVLWLGYSIQKVRQSLVLKETGV